MGRYIMCLTRMLMNKRRVPATSCPGMPSMTRTHCQYCEHWDPKNLDEDGQLQLSRENCSIKARLDSGEYPFDHFCFGQMNGVCEECEYYADGYQGGPT